MDSSKKKSTSVIRTFHGMPWLKKNLPPKDHAQRAVGPDGKILPMKKTDEDYFSGTREAKKLKKKKLKKPKTILTLGALEDLIDSSSPDLNEEPNPRSNSSNSEENSLQTTVSSDIMWSKDESTADKLFPNVQSVVIDRNDEADMLTEALAESVPTLQLERIKGQTILDRWEEALYGDGDGDGDDEDEGGWDNVRRNLPSPMDLESSTFNDRNNNSFSKHGILRHGQNNLNRMLAEPESIDFEFRKLSESLKQEIRAGRSLKSVSFSRTLIAENPSGKSSKKDESENIDTSSMLTEPNTDKYGRIDGYSERRLFMGKGARMKELQYIQEIRQQDSIPESRTATVPEDKSYRDDDLVAMQPLQEPLKLEEKITTVVEPMILIKNPVNPFAEVKTWMTVIEIPEIQNPEKPRIEVENQGLEKTEQPTTGVEQQQEKLETLMTEVENRDSAVPEKPSIAVEEAKKPHEQMPKLENQEPPQPEFAIVTENETHPMIETLVILPPVQEVRVLEEKPTTAVEMQRTNESEIMTTGMEAAESPEPEKTTIPEKQQQLTKICHDIRYMKVEPTSVMEKLEPRRPEKSKNGTGNQTKKSKELKGFDRDKNLIKKLNKPKIEAFSSRNSKESSVSLPPKTKALKSTETKVRSMDTKPGTTRDNPETKYEFVTNNRNVKMASCGTQTDDGYKPGNETSFRDSQKKISNETVTRALVPTRVWDDSVEDDSTIDFESIDSIDLTPEPQFGSAAWHNLQLTGASFGDTSYEAMSPHTIPQYSQYQNNFVPNSVPLNNLPIPYQAFNNGLQTPQIPNYFPTGYGYMLVGLPNGFTNPDFTNSSYPNNIVYKPVERREDLPDRENLNFDAFQLKSDYERRFQTALTAPPGFVKSLQLPPGLTRNEKKPDNGDVGSDSSESVQSTKFEVQQKKATPSRSTVGRPGRKRRNKRKQVRRNQTQDLNRSETGSEYRNGENEKYPQRRAHYYRRESKFEAVKSRHDPKSTSLRDATKERSAIWIEKNNHELTESVDSLVDNCPHSEMPLVYQTPNQHPSGIGGAANRQCQADAMNPSPMPPNWIFGYQYTPSIQNPHTLASGFYNPMTYHPQLMNPVQEARETNFSYNTFSPINNTSLGTVDTGISKVQQYSAVGSDKLNAIPTAESVPKAPKGRGRGRAHQK